MAEELVFCEPCLALGISSRVYKRDVKFLPQPATSVLVYYDKTGHYHIHDANFSEQKYMCDRVPGPPHMWWVTTHRKCPNPTCTYDGEHPESMPAAELDAALPLELEDFQRGTLPDV